MATSLFRSCLAGSEEASTSEAKAAGKHHQHSNSLKTRPLRSVAGFARYCFTPQGEPSPPTSTSSYNSRSRISSNHSSNHHRSVRGPGAATTDPPVVVCFRVHRAVSFGQHVALVGKSALLGKWNIEDAVPMEWEEGDLWAVELDMHTWEMEEYKYIVRSGFSGSREVIWQPGPNNLLATNRHAVITIEDTWELEGSESCRSRSPYCAAAAAAVAASGEAYERNAPQRMALSAERGISPSMPRWAMDAIVYQIFPLGFFGAPHANDQRSSPVPRLAQLRRYYSYLQSLGVNCVYFGPLFESMSHGYDTIDYFKVDRRLGDLNLLKAVVKELQAMGIRVIFDGVFNHTGMKHFAFEHLQKHGAADSKYANWYHIGARRDDHPAWTQAGKGGGFSYDCWEGHPELPRLELSNLEVRAHIFEVAKFYLTEVGIDGWRLDVAHQIDPSFWAQFRAQCKAAAPNCLLIAELMHGNYTTWVGPQLLDTATNCQLSKALWSSFNSRNMFELSEALLRDDVLYSSFHPMNFLGNHDTPRVASRLTHAEHNHLALTFLFACRGIPALYYGDELGLKGDKGEADAGWGGDAGMRQAMPPPPDELKLTSGTAGGDMEAEARRTLRLTRELARMHSEVEVLRIGSQEGHFVVNTQHALAMVRRTISSHAVVALNCGDAACTIAVHLHGLLTPGTIFRDRMAVGPPDSLAALAAAEAAAAAAAGGAGGAAAGIAGCGTGIASIATACTRLQDVHLEEERKLLDVSTTLRDGREGLEGDDVFRVGGECVRVGADGSLLVSLPPNTIRVLVEQPGLPKPLRRSSRSNSFLVET